MIFQTIVVEWKGNKNREGKTWVLNANRIHALRRGPTSIFIDGSRWRYSDIGFDRRDKDDLVGTNDTVSTIKTAMDGAFSSVSITLPVYENDDTTTATVDKTFSWAYLVKAIDQVGSDGARCYIWWAVGAFRVERVLVPYNIAQIVDLASTGTTTTTTTSTTSTSTTSTSTTSTSTTSTSTTSTTTAQ